MGMNWRGSKPIQQVGSQRLAKSLSKPRLTSNFILGSTPAQKKTKQTRGERTTGLMLLLHLRGRRCGQELTWEPSKQRGEEHRHCKKPTSWISPRCSPAAEGLPRASQIPQTLLPQKSHGAGYDQLLFLLPGLVVPTAPRARGCVTVFEFEAFGRTKLASLRLLPHSGLV